MSGSHYHTKSSILEELVHNTGADRDFAFRLLQDTNWQFPADTYRRIEEACIESAREARSMQSNRGTQIPIEHVTSNPRSLQGQRGGGAVPHPYTNTGVGRAGVSPGSSRPRYDPRQYTSTGGSGFPDPWYEERPRSQVENRGAERIVPIQVERGTAVKLPTQPSSSQPVRSSQQLHYNNQPSPQQERRVLPNTPTQQSVFKVPQVPPLQRQSNVQEGGFTVDQRNRKVSSHSEKPKEPVSINRSGGDHTPKLKRGISNIMENASLVSEARSSVLHDIEEDSHDHMYLLTFVLPDLTVYSEDFRAYLEKDLIETSTLVSLEQAGRLNWWAEMRLCQRLLPMATSGDGNCLLHAASLAMWGIHDRQLILRNALYDKLTAGPCKDNLYRRWRWQQTLSNKESGLVLSEEEWQTEWDNLLKLSSPTPRTFPETSKRNSCCDSPVTQGNTSADPVVYESLEEFHVFVLALVLQRPIIIVADTVLKDTSGEALAPIPFGGIYLPVECEPRMCHRSPLLLTYDAAHFSALVPMEQENSPEDRPYLPAAIPLVDPSFQLLPLHFHIDPGPRYDWNKPNNKKISELSVEDKLNLLQQYMYVEKLQLPVLDDYDSDKMSCGSYESDDSVGCVGNKEKKKDAKQQMHSVAKQFGSIGKSMGKKLKKNFGSIGKAMKNIGDSDKHHRRKSVGSVITQSTKVIATIATDIGRDRIWCARLTVTRSKMQQELVKNYLHTTEQRFEKDRELWRRKNEEIRNRVSMHGSAPTVACVTPGCQMFGTHETAYLCSKCFSQQKQEALDKEKQKGQFVYNTFPGRNKAAAPSEDTIVKYGKSKFYCGGEDFKQDRPVSQESRLGVSNTIDRNQSYSVNDVSRMVDKGLHLRTPSPDYDNVDYKEPESHPRETHSTYNPDLKPLSGGIATATAAARPHSAIGETRPGSMSQTLPRMSGGTNPVRQSIASHASPQVAPPAKTGIPPGNLCRNQGCDFYGSPELDNLCSGCHKLRQQSIQAQARVQTRL